MNRSQAILISDKIKKAIIEIGEQHNLDFNFDGISFTTATLNLKISAQERNSTHLKQSMTILSKKLGFTQNIIGMEFSCSNGEFIIESIKPRNRKYPIIAKRKIDGAQYKFSEKNVLKYIGGNSMLNRVANLENLLGQ